MDFSRGKPNDTRGFIHKRIFGGIKGAIGGLLGGGPLGALGGAFRGFARGGEPAGPPPPVGISASLWAERTDAHARIDIPCRTVGLIRDQSGTCAPRFLGGRADLLNLQGSGAIPGLGRGGRALTNISAAGTRGPNFCPAGHVDLGQGCVTWGEAVVGRFGAGLEPLLQATERRLCPRGSVLGVDGLCYNKGVLRNTDRFWPRGRRPLLTGGEMRCISVAARAANKLQRKQSQLMAMGMLKRPARRAQKALPSGHHRHVAHD